MRFQVKFERDFKKFFNRTCSPHMPHCERGIWNGPLIVGSGIRIHRLRFDSFNIRRLPNDEDHSV